MVNEERKPTMLGGMVRRLYNARKQTKMQAEFKLWERNGLSRPSTREGYKLAETATVQRDGTEVVEYRLYKLIDRAIVTVGGEILTTTHFGLEPPEENEDAR